MKAHYEIFARVCGTPLMETPPARRSKLQAQFDFQARVPNELSFKEGEIIDLIEKHESGMWKGELRGRVGLFPYNFVQEISSGDEVREGASGQPDADPTPALQLPKEGWLTKQGHVRKSWKTRWFVLQENTLSYYQNKNAKPSGVIDLRGAAVKSGEDQTRRNYCFHIYYPNKRGAKEFFICAENGLEMNEWVTAINAASKL
eukprot:gnl/Trimastix_PCT/1390.p1 GENE.gnl/Trimastix_PCT/1390~~gnl/Trimastix_PCT/1390.p1  ORF type:complete len:202 (+),score=35.43 gnl/Trimastix_PCT/1390:43-648(+)